MEFRRMDSVLISSFVERWHPETNSFHFPWGEITITLRDVVQILDIPIDDAVVCSMSDETIDTAMGEILVVDARIARSLGRGAGYPMNSTLKDRARALCNARDRDEHHVATLYLAMLLGFTLFPDKSGMKVAKRLVGCVIDHEQTGGTPEELLH